MASIMDVIFALEEVKDHRSDGYFLGDWPVSTTLILMVYLVIVFKILPAFMSNRKAYDLRNTIMAYNWFQIMANTYLCFHAATYCLSFNLTCNAIDSSDNPDLLFLVTLFYYYHVLKLIDLVETIFFILRKKQSQVTFLHVYHHVLMAYTSGIYFRIYPGGQSVYLGLANTFVHVVMYLYYFLTAWDTSYKQSIWWKKHITQIQLIQHVLVTFCFSAPLLVEDCAYPKIACYLALPNCLVMIYLFGEFYWRNYIKKKEE